MPDGRQDSEPDEGGQRAGRPGPGRQSAHLAAEVARVADRLRSLGQARMAAAVAGGPSRADRGRAVAQSLADAAAALRGDPVQPVPRLGDHAVGDQVAVTGHELLDALSGCADEAAASAAVSAAVEDLRALRLLL